MAALFFGADERLVAAPRTNGELMLIWIRPRVDGEPLRRTLDELARGGVLESIERLVAPSVNGETAIVRIRADGETQSLRLAVVDVADQRVSVVAMAFAPARFTEVDARFRALLRTVRPATEAELRRAQPLRIGIEQARVSRSFAPDMQPFPDHARERWELLNQLYPGGPVSTGRWIKTVH